MADTHYTTAGCNNISRRLSAKTGERVNSMINKIALVQESFRLTPENSAKLESLKQATGVNKNQLINQMIQEYKAEGSQTK
jgi:hypothetical protein